MMLWLCRGPVKSEQAALPLLFVNQESTDSVACVYYPQPFINHLFPIHSGSKLSKAQHMEARSLSGFDCEFHRKNCFSSDSTLLISFTVQHSLARTPSPGRAGLHRGSAHRHVVIRTNFVGIRANLSLRASEAGKSWETWPRAFNTN